MTFWDHLDDLRTVLIRIVVAVLLCTVVVFCCKEVLFDIVLAPQSADFFTYRLLEELSGEASVLAKSPSLINTGLAHQFLLHVRLSVFASLLLTSPYILYQVFLFVAPALYQRERRYALQLVLGGSLMFVLGLLLSYYMVFPLTYRFLGTYQVSEVVENTVTLQSYIDTLLSISLAMALVFEIPVLCWVLGKMGILRAALMRRYRRHVCVALLILAAIITPTSDVFTLMLVSLPMLLLYELSIAIVVRINR